MYAMPHGDDLDQRFNDLVSQMDADEQRRMRSSAKKGAKSARSASNEDKERLREAGRLRRDAGRAGWDATPPPPRRRRAGRAWLAGAAITVTLAAAAVVVTMRPDLFAPSGPLPGDTFELAPVDVTRPFAGSPADKYADGAAGFTLPEAEAIGGLTKKDVATGLDRARELLAAAYLDKKTVLGGKPEAFAKLLHRDQRGWFRENLTDKKYATRYMVHSFAPGSVELTTDVIKVNGRATLGTFKEKELRGASVKLNYLVVYAVHQPGRPLTMMRVVAHVTGEIQLFRQEGRLVTWVEDLGAATAPARCDTDDGFVHPYFDDSAPDSVKATGKPKDPYALDQPESDECTTTDPT